MVTGSNLYALAIACILAAGCTQPRAPTAEEVQPSATPSAPLKAAFDAKGLLDEQLSVLVQAMVEDEATVELRARDTGLESGAVRPKAFGLRIFVVRKNAEVGTAFFSSTQIYHLESMPGQIIIDRRYLYGMGFATEEVIQINDKSWSERYSVTASEMNQLDALAEAVHAGRGAKEAYEATQLFGPLSKSGAKEENLSERTVTWLVGRQSLEGIFLKVDRSKSFGNRIDPAFVAEP